MLKTTKSPDMPVFRKKNGNNEVIRFDINRNANRSNKKLKQKLFKSKNLCPTNATKECNFLTFDAKTNLRF